MTTFILPWEYWLYDCKTNDINDDDDNADGDNDLSVNSGDEVGSSNFFAMAVIAEVVEEFEIAKKKSHSTRSATAIRRSK
jgi:hypothetical protein